MNIVQSFIFIVVVLIILALVIYHLKQERYFKQLLENQDTHQNNTDFFDNIELEIDSSFDWCITVVFPSSVRLNEVPPINHTNTCFVMENCSWVQYKGEKKYTTSLRCLIPLVLNQSLISPEEAENIISVFEDMYKNATIKFSNYREEIDSIKTQLSTIGDIELELELYLVNKNPIQYQELTAYLSKKHDSNSEFFIQDELGNGFVANQSYEKLSIRCKLHHCISPLVTIEKIFDTIEDYNIQFESRLLTQNNLLFTKKDYDFLIKQVSNYVNTAERNSVVLGSELIKKYYKGN